MGSPQGHLSYTLGDSPVRLWNAELACQSMRHWSGMVQRIIWDWRASIRSVSSVVADVI